MWSECKCISRHRSDALFVLHPSQNDPLPAPMVKSSFARKVYANDITSKPFRIDPQTRVSHRSTNLLNEQIQSHEPSVQLESASSKRKAEQGAQIPKRQAGGVRGGAGLPPQQAGDGDHRRIARDDDTRQGQWQGRRSTRRRAGAGQP